VELVIHGSPSKLNNKNMGHHAFYQINLERGQTSKKYFPKFSTEESWYKKKK
jgi:hypothetical protein